MAIIRTPRKSLPTFTKTGNVITIVVEGATVTSGWSVVLKSDLMTASDAGWACTSVSATTSGGNVTITATVPNTAPPELLDLVVAQSSVGTLTAVQAVAVKTTLTPTSMLLWLRTDMHGRYDSVQANTSSDTNRKESLWRTWQLVRAQNEPLSVLNPWAILNGGDIGYALNSNGIDVAEGSGSYARFTQETRALTVPEIIVPGNHDRGRSGSGGTTYDTAWAEALGPRYGVTDLATNLRVVSHDYTDAAAVTPSTNALNASFTGTKLFVQHKNDEWDRVTQTTGFLFELVGHLHNTKMLQSSPRIQMLFGAHKWGIGWPVVLTKSGTTYGYGTSFDSLSDGSVKEKLVGDNGTKRLSVNYSQSNNGSARSMTVNITNGLPFGNTDGRIRLVMQQATYNVSGGTLLASYNIAGNKTVLIIQVSIPANGSTSLSAAATTNEPDPDPEPPPPSSNASIPLVLFYGLPGLTASGASISNRETYFATAPNKPGIFIIKTRSDIGSGNQWNNYLAAGYDNPGLLYQRPPTEVQTSGTLLGSQLWDGSSQLQSLYDAMVGNNDCYLYANSGYTTKIPAISNSGYSFDPAHPAVRAFAKAASLKHLQAYPTVAGIFWDNVGLFENANDDSGKVFSKYLGVEYTSATMDAQEQAMFTEIHNHVNSNLGRSWIHAANLLAGSQTRNYRDWPFQGIMLEGVVGYTQSGGYNSVPKQTSIIQRCREFLLASASNFLILANQAASATTTAVHDFGFGVALAVMASGNTPAGAPRTSYRFTNSTKYGEYWPQSTEYGAMGAPLQEPAISGNIVTRRFETGEVTINLADHTKDTQVLPPDDVDPPASNDNQFVATVVGVRADLPNGAIRDGSTIAIDGSPRAAVLVKVTVAAGLPVPSVVRLAMPVAIGASVTPHAQLVEAFDPATVTWSTRPRVLSQSYPTGVSVLVSNSTVAFQVTEVAKLRAGNDIYFCLLMDADTEPSLFPSATLVWN